MLTLDSARPGIVLLRQRPAKAVMLSGLLTALFGVVPLVIAPGLGVTRGLSSFVLFVTAGALIWLGRPRREGIELVLGSGGIRLGLEPLPPAARLELGGDTSQEPPLYQAVLRFSDGQGRVLLEHDEPSRVLADALTLCERLELPLCPGWGLERHFPATALETEWRRLVDDGAERRTSRDALSELPLWPTQRLVAFASLAASAFVLVVTTVLVKSPFRSVAPSTFSLVLPGVSAGLVLVLGLVLLGLRRRLRFSAEGTLSSLLLFGVAIGRTTRLGPVPAAAFRVAPDGNAPRHLLLATPGAPISVTSETSGECGVFRAVDVAVEPAANRANWGVRA